jgi:2-polyprenyl-3-methyl-5-hydroxy-6-metoxy-1,4-benzoquinol methylase
MFDRNGTVQATLQEAAYSFPYHHLPAVEADGAITIHRHLGWGLEYLTYITHVRDVVRALKPQSFLDVGCGDGRLVAELAPSVSRCVGMDVSPRALAFARAFSPTATFIPDALEAIHGRFDVVACVETLEHIPDAEIPAFVESLAAKTSPAGRLVVTVPSTVLPLNPKHHRHYTLDLLRRQLESHFSFIEGCHLFRRSLTSYVLTRLLANRFFVLTSRRLRRWIWSIHKRRTFFGSEASGEHVFGIFRPAEPSV